MTAMAMVWEPLTKIKVQSFSPDQQTRILDLENLKKRNNGFQAQRVSFAEIGCNPPGSAADSHQRRP